MIADLSWIIVEKSQISTSFSVIKRKLGLWLLIWIKIKRLKIS